MRRGGFETRPDMGTIHRARGFDQSNPYVFKTVDDNDAFVAEIRIAREDDILAAGEGFADRLECLAAHEHRVPQRELFEAFEILRHMPGQLIFKTDDAIEACGNDEGEGHIGIYALRFTWDATRKA